MPHIKVNTGAMDTFSTEFEEIRQRLYHIKADCDYIHSTMDFNIRETSGASPNLTYASNGLYGGLTSLSKMRDFMSLASGIYADPLNFVEQYDSQCGVVDNVERIGNLAGIGNEVLGLTGFIKTLLKSGDEAKLVTYKLLKGTNILDINGNLVNYKDFISKSAQYSKKFDVLDKVGVALDIVGGACDAYSGIKNTWSDENKTTEKKVYDTIAIAGCTAAGIAVNVAGQVVGKAVTGVITGACCAIPVVGPVVGVVLGTAAGAVVSGAIGVLADTIASPEIIAQTSQMIENTVGAVKAGCSAIGDAAKKIAEADNFIEGALAVQNTIKTVGKEAAKVAVTAAVEVTKTCAKVVTETVKNVGNAVKKLFKGW